MCLSLLLLRCLAVELQDNNRQKFVAFLPLSMLFWCNKLQLWRLRGFSCELSQLAS